MKIGIVYFVVLVAMLVLLKKIVDYEGRYRKKCQELEKLKQKIEIVAVDINQQTLVKIEEGEIVFGKDLNLYINCDGEWKKIIIDENFGRSEEL